MRPSHHQRRFSGAIRSAQIHRVALPQEEVVVVELHRVDAVVRLQMRQRSGAVRAGDSIFSRPSRTGTTPQKLQRNGQPMLAWWTAVPRSQKRARDVLLTGDQAVIGQPRQIVRRSQRPLARCARAGRRRPCTRGRAPREIAFARALPRSVPEASLRPARAPP